MSATAKVAVLQMIIHCPRGALLAGLFLALAFAAAGGTASDPKPTRFDDALEQVRASVRTPKGRRYDSQVGRQFAQDYQAAMIRCTTSVEDQDLVPFQLLFQVARDGSVKQILVSPETKVAVCLEKQVAAGKFPKPPKRLYWVHVSMNLAP